MTSRLRDQLEQSIQQSVRDSDARMIGRVDVLLLSPHAGPTERMFHAWLKPSHGQPVERVCPGVTGAACRDAHETLIGLIEDMALDPKQSWDTNVLMKAARIVNRKANGE